MTWFRVDDTLAAHSKTRKAGLPAMGLWVVAGSWSSQQLTEGFIPDWFVESWPRGKQYAANLVRAQLWFESNSGSERGYQFNDWTQCNPTADQVKTERAAAAERQRRAREKAAQARAGANRHAVTDGVTDGVTHGEVTANVTRESQSESRSPRPDPTRPTTSSDEEVVLRRKRATAAPDSFPIDDTMRAWAERKEIRINLETETEAFLDHHRAKGSTFTDWRSAWRMWMRNAVKFANSNVRQIRANAGNTSTNPDNAGKVRMRQTESGRWREVYDDEVLFGVHTEWRTPQ